MPTKREILQQINFGKRVAEEEAAELSQYFVETDQWRRIFAGEVDVVYGPKGSGKSALYSLLLNYDDKLLERNILVVNAENPRGNTVFRSLETDPPVSEEEFRNLWKLYLVSLVALQLRVHDVTPQISRKVILPLEEAKLIPKLGEDFTLNGILSRIRNYVRRVGNVEGTASYDPATGAPSFTGRINFGSDDYSENPTEEIHIDEMFRLANQALIDAGFQIWILLDRLDVAFAENLELEKNALRALFRVYLDLMVFENVNAKIFLRNDIWKRITEQGFREASHITSTVSISWSKPTLLNLVVRRLLHNKPIREYYGVSLEEILSDASSQETLFYKMFPDQVDLGEKKPRTLDWMLTRTQDGTKENVPRELIHLLDATKEEQLKRIEIGAEQSDEIDLFERISIKAALPTVSETRYHQTLVAEYPSLKEFMDSLEDEKTNQTPTTLANIWRVDETEALKIAVELSEIGFFEKRGTKEEPEFWVPFLYRDALNLIQGTAE